MGTVSRCGPASLGAGEQHAEGRMRPPAGWKKRELLPPWEYPPEAFPFPFGKDERNTVHLLCRRVPVPPQPSPQPPESSELRRGRSANQEPRPAGSQDSSWWGPPHPAPLITQHPMAGEPPQASPPWLGGGSMFEGSPLRKYTEQRLLWPCLSWVWQRASAWFQTTSRL